MAETTDEFGREKTETRPPKQPTIDDQTTKWANVISSTLDVETILSYMTTAERGFFRYQMEMFDRMVERDPHLEAVLQTRRMGLTQSDWMIVPADEEDSRAIDAADFVRDELRGLGSFEDTIDALQDAVPKGYGVQEIVYSDAWGLEDLIEIPQKLLDWTEDDLRIMADGKTAVEMTPNKFVVHSPRIRAGTPVRRGLMRSLAIYWCISHFALEDWAAFVEVFGQPLRLGTYPANMKGGDLTVLSDALTNLGSDAAGMIPEGMTITFPEPTGAKSSGAVTPMETVINYVERKMSIAVLGQNLTTESQSGTGTLAGSAHENVRRDILRADARQLGTSLRRDLFTPLVGFKMGFEAPVPRIVWDLDDPLDQQARAGVFKTMVEIGFPLSQAQIRDELQLREPTDDEDLLQPETVPEEGLTSAVTAEGGGVALSSAGRANEKLGSSAADAGGEAIDQIMGLVGRLAESSDSPEALLTRIKLAAPDLEELLDAAGIPMDEFEDLAARTLLTADYNGRTAVRAERKV